MLIFKEFYKVRENLLDILIFEVRNVMNGLVLYAIIICNRINFERVGIL